MKNIKCIYPVLVICICFLLSCKEQNAEKRFFDIPGYFKAQEDSIKLKYSVFHKYSVYNDDTSFQKINVADVNWDKEFAMFLECNLNTPIYYANAEKTISGDSLIFEDEVYKIESDKPYIKEVAIKKRAGKVFMISIDLRKENLIASTSVKLFYHTLFIPFLVDHPKPEILYTIEGTQTLKGLNQTNTFMIRGIISNRN